MRFILWPVYPMSRNPFLKIGERVELCFVKELRREFAIIWQNTESLNSNVQSSTDLRENINKPFENKVDTKNYQYQFITVKLHDQFDVRSLASPSSSIALKHIKKDGYSRDVDQTFLDELETPEVREKQKKYPSWRIVRNFLTREGSYQNAAITFVRQSDGSYQAEFGGKENKFILTLKSLDKGDIVTNLPEQKDLRQPLQIFSVDEKKGVLTTESKQDERIYLTEKTKEKADISLAEKNGIEALFETYVQARASQKPDKPLEAVLRYDTFVSELVTYSQANLNTDIPRINALADLVWTLFNKDRSPNGSTEGEKRKTKREFLLTQMKSIQGDFQTWLKKANNTDQSTLASGDIPQSYYADKIKPPDNNTNSLHNLFISLLVQAFKPDANVGFSEDYSRYLQISTRWKKEREKVQLLTTQQMQNFDRGNPPALNFFLKQQVRLPKKLKEFRRIDILQQEGDQNKFNIVNGLIQKLGINRELMFQLAFERKTILFGVPVDRAELKMSELIFASKFNKNNNERDIFQKKPDFDSKQWKDFCAQIPPQDKQLFLSLMDALKDIQEEPEKTIIPDLLRIDESGGKLKKLEVWKNGKYKALSIPKGNTAFEKIYEEKNTADRKLDNVDVVVPYLGFNIKTTINLDNPEKPEYRCYAADGKSFAVLEFPNNSSDITVTKLNNNNSPTDISPAQKLVKSTNKNQLEFSFHSNTFSIGADGKFAPASILGIKLN